MRAPLALLLFAAGALLAAAPAQARIVQPEAPPAPVAERGGRPVPGGSHAAPVCSWPGGLDLAATLFFDACFGMQASEYLARITAANRLALEAHRRAWRAPRIAAERAREQRRERLAHR